MPSAAFLIPAAVAMLALWRAAGFYFLSDDFLLLRHAMETRQHPWTPFLSPGGDGFFRPFGYLLLGLNSLWAGTSPVAWHLSGFLLHAANASLVAILASELEFSPAASLFAGVLFALHPTRPEAAVWVAGRFDLLATLFGLLALILFLRSWRAAPVAALILAILCKESAYAIPLMALAIAWSKRAPRLALPQLIAAAALGLWRLILFRGIGGYADTLSLGGSLKALALRVWAVLFFPVNWSFSAGAWVVIAGAIYLAGLALVLRGRASRERLTLAVLLVVLAALPPLAQLLIGADLQKSRLVYLPSVGFALLLAAAVEALERRAQWTAMAAIALSYVLVLQHNLNAWEYASSRTQPACAAAAACDRPQVRGLPGSLRGVYFFANGFEECVRIQPAPAQTRQCNLEWDTSADRVREAP